MPTAPSQQPVDEQLVAAWHSTMNMAEIATSLRLKGHQVYVHWARLRQVGRIPCGSRPTTYRRTMRPLRPPKPPRLTPALERDSFDAKDGRPRVPESGDPLLAALLKVHGAPRYDIPEELRRHHHASTS